MSGALAWLRALGRAAGIIQAISNGSGVSPQSFGVNSNGQYANGGSAGNWVVPTNAATAANYQVKVDVTGGSFTSGEVTGTYVDCSSTRTWTRTGAGTVTFTVTFREKGSGVVRGSTAGVTLTVS